MLLHILIAHLIIFMRYMHLIKYTPGPPRYVTLTAPTSTTLLLRWNQPEEDPGDGTISHYIILCGFGDGDSLQPRDVSASTRSLQLTGLRPFTTYKCCVSAQRTNGNSPESCSSAVTPQDGEKYNYCRLNQIVHIVHWCRRKSTIYF